MFRVIGDQKVAFVVACGIGMVFLNYAPQSLFAQTLCSTNCWVGECQEHGDPAKGNDGSTNEQLLLDIKKTHKTGLFGFRMHEIHILPSGSRITRYELTTEKEGPISGNAKISSINDREAVVYIYLDLFSELTYSLRVWGTRR
jgi:hypothetical protein